EGSQSRGTAGVSNRLARAAGAIGQGGHAEVAGSRTIHTTRGLEACIRDGVKHALPRLQPTLQPLETCCILIRLRRHAEDGFELALQVRRREMCLLRQTRQRQCLAGILVYVLVDPLPQLGGAVVDAARLATFAWSQNGARRRGRISQESDILWFWRGRPA